MKRIHLIWLMCLLLIAGNSLAQQKSEINLADSTGLPGDNFSLEGALGVFKDSKSLEDFEKKLNQKDNAINNLDLNGDGKVDYVKVIADKKADAHVVILRIPVSKTENQDVAVIEIEKKGDQSAMLQILGDESLYGETRIVEPVEDNEPGDPGIMKKGPSAFSHSSAPFYVNVWFWPCIRFMYAPVYVVYVSPWYWDFYPGWWHPWHPFPWRYHYMHTWHYHHHYRVVYDHRATYAHQIYAPRRTTSTQVMNRYNEPIRKYRDAQTTRPRSGKNVNQERPQTKPQQQIRPDPRTMPNEPRVKPEQRPQSKPVAKPSDRPQAKPMSPPDRNPRSQPKATPRTQPSKSPARPQQTPKSKSPQQRQPR